MLYYKFKESDHKNKILHKFAYVLLKKVPHFHFNEPGELSGMDFMITLAGPGVRGSGPNYRRSEGAASPASVLTYLEIKTHDSI